MTQSIITELQNEEIGRKLLSLVGTNPVKSTEVTVNFDTQTVALDHITNSPNFDAGWIVGISVNIATTFDAGTTNTLGFSYATDLSSVSPSSIDFATCNLATGDEDGHIGAQVNGLPATGTDKAFTPIRVADVRFRVLMEYAFTGTDPTQGVAKVLFQYVSL